MKLSLKSIQDLARSPKGKQLLRQAKAYDTPENRKKAMEMLNRLRESRSKPKKRAA